MAELICGFLASVDYGTDFESQLRFYTDCRGKFRQLDAVQVGDLTKQLKVPFKKEVVPVPVPVPSKTRQNSCKLLPTEARLRDGRPKFRNAFQSKTK